jgi:hypothetical protein
MGTKNSPKILDDDTIVENHYQGNYINLGDIYQDLPLLIKASPQNKKALLTLISYHELLSSCYDFFAYQTLERQKLFSDLDWQQLPLAQLMHDEPVTPQEKFYLNVALTSKVIQSHVPHFKSDARTSSDLLHEAAASTFCKALYYYAKRNHKKKFALEYHQKAVALNYIPSLFEIGYSLLKKAHSEHDREKALRYISEAATQGYATAHFYLGLLYTGKTKYNNRADKTKAYTHYKKAAKLGCLQAYHNLAALILHDPEKKQTLEIIDGFSFLKKSAEAGYAPSQAYLGALLYAETLYKNLGIKLLNDASLQSDCTELCNRTLKAVQTVPDNKNNIDQAPIKTTPSHKIRFDDLFFFLRHLEKIEQL